MHLKLAGKIAIPFLSIAASLSLAQVKDDAVGPVSNWAAPLYWRATVSKTASAHRNGRTEEAIGREVIGTATTTLGVPAVFVAITPCRLADTRAGGAPFGGPPLGAGQTRVIPVPSGPCSIPANAVAYSLNIGRRPGRNDNAVFDSVERWRAATVFLNPERQSWSDYFELSGRSSR